MWRLPRQTNLLGASAAGHAKPQSVTAPASAAAPPPAAKAWGGVSGGGGAAAAPPAAAEVKIKPGEQTFEYEALKGEGKWARVALKRPATWEGGGRVVSLAGGTFIMRRVGQLCTAAACRLPPAGDGGGATTAGCASLPPSPRPRALSPPPLLVAQPCARTRAST